MQTIVCLLSMFAMVSAAVQGIFGGIPTNGNLLRNGLAGVGGPAVIGHDLHTTITRHIGVPIPQPFAFPVERHVALPFRVAVAVPVDRPFAVPVARHFPVPVDRPFAVAVDRPFPIAVPHPVAVPFIRQVGVPIPQPFAVGVQTPVQVPLAQQFAIPISAAGLGGGASDLRLSSHFGGLGVGLSLGNQVGIQTL